ncbi:MAG: TetR/AcrR family transcriptional regulator [Leptonema sp. (in: bacteria)]
MPKIVDHEEYKKQVLEKCIDIFYKQGYRNVSLRDIAKHLKVSVGSLYYYFPSKKELFLEMYKMLQEKSKKEFHEILKDCKNSYQKVEKFLLTLLDNPTIVQKQTILLFDLIREDDPENVKKIAFYFIRQFALSIQEELDISFEESQMILVFIAGLVQGNFIINNKKFFKPPVSEFLKVFKNELNNKKNQS